LYEAKNDFFVCLKQCLSSAFLGFYGLRVWKILFLVLLFDTFLFLSKTSIYSFFGSCDWVRIEKLVEKYWRREKVVGWPHFGDKKSHSWCQRVLFDERHSIEVFYPLSYRKKSRIGFNEKFFFIWFCIFYDHFRSVLS
jgi:hypothetical protein